MSNEKPIIVRTMVLPEEECKTDKGAKCAIEIRKEIECLSKHKLKLKPTDPRVEGGYDKNYHEKPKDLDYDVYCDSNLISKLEPSCPIYTFAGSKFFPINAYKIRFESNIPVFFVYSLELEPCDLPKRCWWITKEKALHNLLQPEPMWLKTKMPNGQYKPQLNYLTDKYAWHRGLQSLVDELLGMKQIN